MFGEDSGMIDLILILMIIALGVLTFKRISKMKPDEKKAANVQPQPSNTTQLVEDIKMTQTSRIVDAVAVMDDMAETSHSTSYRHYCELIGKSMGSGGVIAPYSRREVAYYDLRCYRIENRNGRDVETLVAHEKSIDPFYFTDSSCDTRIYVDLDTFGNNCILVNATNRVEGPNSDFSKAFNQASNQNGGGRSGAYAIMSQAIQAGRNVLAGTAQRLANVVTPTRTLQPAYAVATGARTIVDIPASALESNLKLANRHNGRGFYGGMGGFGGIPGDLDAFLGGAFSSGSFGGYGGPKIRPGGDVGSLIGIGLGALLSTLATSNTQAATGNRPQYEQQTPFRGYRLIEDVVPLNSPIYCIGEIYRHDSDIHMGRSVSDSYPSSYFAVKQEAEVIDALK